MDKNKIYNYAFGASLGVAFVGTIVTLVMLIGSYRTNQELQQIEKQKFDQFYEKCALACAPNGVYSISYSKCACSAIVVYRDVKP